MTLKGLEGPPHVGRSNIAVPSIYKEVHVLSKNTMSSCQTVFLGYLYFIELLNYFVELFKLVFGSEF